MGFVARSRCERAVVIARAVADAMAAPVEAGERHEQEIRIDGGRLEAGSGIDIAPARSARPARQRRKVERRAARTDRQRGREALARRARREARACPARRESGERPRRSRARQRRARRSPSSASRAVSGARVCGSSASRRPSARGAAPTWDRRRSEAVRRFADPVRHKARSREGRWTVIPGAYVSRWEPCAEAHGRGQGQPP